MNDTTERGGARTSKVVRMYPDNQLKGQVRNFSETLSAFDVIAEAAKP